MLLQPTTSSTRRQGSTHNTSDGWRNLRSPQLQRPFYSTAVKSVHTGSTTPWYGSCTNVDWKAKWSTIHNAAHPAGLLHQEVHHQSQENHHKRHSPPGNKPPVAAIWLTTPFLHGQNWEIDEELTKSSQAIRKNSLPHTWYSPQTYTIHLHTTNPYLSTFKCIAYICESCLPCLSPDICTIQRRNCPNTLNPDLYQFCYD